MKDQLAILVLVTGLSLGAELPTLAQGLEIPNPIRTEHEELHTKIEDAMQAGGRTGVAAKAVNDALAPHFQKEERYALPQLGVLPRLVGAVLKTKERNLSSQEREELIVRTERFKAELPKMLEEHRAVGIALDELKNVAEAENKPEQAHLAEQIRLHAQTEEQILYPAALLVGEHARLQAASAP
jgi:hypothetical protein